MSEVTFSTLESINKEVNALPYKSDPEQYGKAEFWEDIMASGGDCEDYALAKMHRLKELGVPQESMKLATCWVETGEYHAVLLVDLNDQTWVLDNRYPFPMEYQLLPYKFDLIQISGLHWEKACA